MKLTKIKATIFIIICTLVLGTTIVYGGETYWCDANNSYDWQNGLYCSEPGKPLYLLSYEDGWRSTKVTYDYSNYNNVDIEPSTGYAYYVIRKDGLKLSDYNADMQGVIWESDRWGNVSNVKDNNAKRSSGKGVVYQRATQYGYVYHGVLDKIKGNSVFKTRTNSKDVKVLVDRNSGKYTVGPYTIELNIDGNMSDITKRGAQNLYNEIIKSGNNGRTEANTFAKFDINKDLTGINGSNFEFVNENGQVIPFPKFVPGDIQPFYIRFKPANEGAITETGDPVIKISYLKGFTADSLQKGRATQVTWGAWGGKTVKPIPAGTESSTPGTPSRPTPSTPSTPSGGGNPQPTPQKIVIDFKKGDIQLVSAEPKILNEKHYNADLYITTTYTQGTGPNTTTYTSDSHASHVENIGFDADLEVIYTLNCKVNKTFHGVTIPFVEQVKVKYSTHITEGYTSDQVRHEYINSDYSGGNTYGAATFRFQTEFGDLPTRCDGAAIAKIAQNEAKNNRDYTSYVIVNGQWVVTQLMDSLVTIGGGGGTAKVPNNSSEESIIKRIGMGEETTNFEKLANSKKVTKNVDIDYRKGEIKVNNISYKADKNYYYAYLNDNPDEKKKIGCKAEVTAYIDVISTVKYNQEGDFTKFGNDEFQQRFRLEVPVKTIVLGEQDNVGYDNGHINEFNQLSECSEADIQNSINSYIEQLKNDIAGMNTALLPSTYMLYSPSSWIQRKTVEYEIITYDNSDALSKYGKFSQSKGYNITNSRVVQDIQCVVRVANNQNGITEHWEDSSVQLPGAPIDMQIGGNVWLENINTVSDGKLTPLKSMSDKGDMLFHGIQVKLWESNGRIVATTITDNSGKYRFYGKIEEGKALINPLKQYYVTFEYDGQLYQATYCSSDYGDHNSNPISYSHARETNRKEFNNRFSEIHSSNQGSDYNNYYMDNVTYTNAPGSSLKSNGWHRAYGLDHKITKDDGTYASNGKKNELGNDIALTYEDVYNKFLDLAKLSSSGYPSINDNNKQWQDRSYYSIIYNDNDGGLKKWLHDLGVNKEFDDIAIFIMDSLVEAETTLYPADKGTRVSETEKFTSFILKNSYKERIDSSAYTTLNTSMVGRQTIYLYSSKYDYGSFAGFGFESRKIKNDISIQKDVYKATLIVNGKKEDYYYNERDMGVRSGTWDSKSRVKNDIDNGEKKYERVIRPTDYLFTPKDYGDEDNSKMLQAYVTYKIGIKNNGDVKVKINEVVDYYDANELYNPVNTNVQLVKDECYIGDSEGNKIRDISTNSGEQGTKISNTGMHNRTRSDEKKLKTSTQTKDNGYNYEEVYISNINETLELDKGIQPNEKSVLYIYLTYKVKEETNGKSKDKIRLDYSDNEDGRGDPYTSEDPVLSIGKRNIAEINDYETFYPENSSIPSGLDSNGNTIDLPLGDETIAGLIDYDSNPGSLNNLDIDDNNGMLKIEKKSKIINGKEGLTVNDRQEDDTSQSPNIVFKLNNNDDYVRKFKGYVFEDKREPAKDKTGGAAIGDGYRNEEGAINGVTLELVELVSDIDDKTQLSIGTYQKERIWGRYTYKADGSSHDFDESRYASGDGVASIILNGTGMFKVEDNEELRYNEDGAYVFKSFPAGDFFIRFTYGENDDTALMTDDGALKAAQKIEQNIIIRDDEKESTKVPISVNQVVNRKGRNSKSYNGQDFKSTVYQQGIDQSNVGSLRNSGKINGFTDYDNQNYNTTGVGVYDVTTKSTEEDSRKQMYYYNIAAGDTNDKISDAKDLWYYRERANEYGKGIVFDNNNKVLLNKRAETLTSYYRLSSYQSSKKEVSDGTNKEKPVNEASYRYTNKGEKWYRYLGDEIDGNDKYSEYINEPNSVNTESYDLNLKAIVTDITEDHVRVKISDLPKNNNNENVTYSYFITNKPTTDYEEMDFIDIAEQKMNGNTMEFNISLDSLANNTDLNKALYLYIKRTSSVGTASAADVSNPMKFLINYYVGQQINMINELEENTFMVAQTGVINTEIEYDRDKTTYNDKRENLTYKVDNLNLGLTERPKAQLLLNKEVVNYSITLGNGRELFNAQKTLNNLAYSGHVKHYVERNGGLIGDPKVGKPGDGNNEIIQNYLDNESQAHATVNTEFRLTVENAGEVDYTDAKFYYTGIEDVPDREKNISYTGASKVVDYVPNSFKFVKYVNKKVNGRTISRNEDWNISSVQELVPNYDLTEVDEVVGKDKEDINFINRLYWPELNTYNSLITTSMVKDRGQEGKETEKLKPPTGTDGNAEGDKVSVTLVLSTETGKALENSRLVYNNMAEIIATTNSNGRRCEYTIPGNEEMADQLLGDDAAPEAISSVDRIQVKEIDADSAQKVLILPPTGEENKIAIKKSVLNSLLSWLKW